MSNQNLGGSPNWGDMTLIINVTQEHFDKGLHKDACGCPTALAINDVLKDTFSRLTKNDYNYFSVVSVRQIGIFKDENIKVAIVDTPPKVAEFILDYDWKFNYEPEPFTFEIDGNWLQREDSVIYWLEKNNADGKRAS